MQKRDKLGRFLKGKVNKSVKHCRVKKVKKVAHKKSSNPKKVTVQYVPKNLSRPKIGDLTLFDLQDMIQAEVAFQMKDNW